MMGTKGEPINRGSLQVCASQVCIFRTMFSRDQYKSRHLSQKSQGSWSMSNYQQRPLSDKVSRNIQSRNIDLARWKKKRFWIIPNRDGRWTVWDLRFSRNHWPAAPLIIGIIHPHLSTLYNSYNMIYLLYMVVVFPFSDICWWPQKVSLQGAGVPLWVPPAMKLRNDCRLAGYLNPIAAWHKTYFVSYP